jgi:hypothetical protein
MENRETLNITVFSFKDLAFKDSSKIASNYTIEVDIISPKKSSFLLIKETFNAIPGDIAYIVDEDNKLVYLGLIADAFIEETRTITTNQIIGLFDIEIFAESFTTANIADKLKSIIENYFVNSADTLFNKSYINITIDPLLSTLVGSVQFEDDKNIKFIDYSNLIYNSFGVYMEITLDPNVASKSLNIYITAATKNKILKDNTEIIQNISIIQNNKNIVNRLNLLPKVENIIDIVAKDYYLLSDNTTTEDDTDINRLDPIINKVKFFKDGDDLDAIASQELKGNIYNHLIEFDLIEDNSIIKFLEDFILRDTFTLLFDNQTYFSLFTGYILTSQSNVVKLKYGKVRNKLTEKLNLRGI